MSQAASIDMDVIESRRNESADPSAGSRPVEAPPVSEIPGKEVPAKKADEPAPPKRSKAKFVALGLVIVALIGGGTAYLLSRGHESTDDAQVEGHVQSVSARTNGQVISVAVKDNQIVEAGETLLQLDPADYVAKLDVAKADLAAAQVAVTAADAQLALTEKNVDAALRQAKGGVDQAAGGLSGAQASVEQAKSDIVAAESRQQLTGADYKRTSELYSAGAVSKAELDLRKSADDQAVASLAAARSRLDASRATITAGAGGVELAKGRLAGAESGPEQIATAKTAVDAAKARVDQALAAEHIAELNLSYTKVTSPVRGVVSRRSVEVGQVVSPDRALLAIVPLDDVWVVANFKEDQLSDMREGQKATVVIDAFGGKKLHGHVESFSGGTGARFALLPPDNASGNFVKVVQRVPTLVRIDDANGLELRPGLSAAVTVDTK